MRIASILENQNLEKRIAITPEIAKKYISLGFEVLLPENYGEHLGIKDEEYKKLGTQISKDEKEIINNTNIIVQLGLPAEDFDNAVIRVLDRILATPEIEDPIALTRRSVMYQYADPQLEQLTPLQKQLLRMGPDNIRRVKEQAAALRAAER